MKTRDIVLIAAAGALVYYATRRRTTQRGYTTDVPPPTPITREEYERATRQARGGQVVDIVKNLSEFLSKLGKKQTQPKYEDIVPGQPWYGQRRIGKFNDFTT
jgi:hypothetical protein